MQGERGGGRCECEIPEEMGGVDPDLERDMEKANSFSELLHVLDGQSSRSWRFLRTCRSTVRSGLFRAISFFSLPGWRQSPALTNT